MIAQMLSGWEIVLILAVVLILCGTKHLLGTKHGPDILHGFRDGLDDFSKEWLNLFERSDRDAHDAGRSIGGVFGKPATEALTPNNQVAELYDPAVFRKNENHRHPNLIVLLARWLRTLALRVLQLFSPR
jgi:Sec-independent protein translocase protein TatA